MHQHQHQHEPIDQPTGGTAARRMRDSGAGLVEYALLVALIALACVAALEVFGVTNGGSINSSASTYNSAVN